MSEPNFLQQIGNFGAQAQVDNTVDNIINQGIDAVASHIPGGEAFEQQLKTEVDQVANNFINNELNKGVGGIEQDIAGIFHHNQDS